MKNGTEEEREAIYKLKIARFSRHQNEAIAAWNKVSNRVEVEHDNTTGMTRHGDNIISKILQYRHEQAVQAEKSSYFALHAQDVIKDVRKFEKRLIGLVDVILCTHTHTP